MGIMIPMLGQKLSRVMLMIRQQLYNVLGVGITLSQGGKDLRIVEVDGKGILLPSGFAEMSGMDLEFIKILFLILGKLGVSLR
jgi:hypothetical protein